MGCGPSESSKNAPADAPALKQDLVVEQAGKPEESEKKEKVDIVPADAKAEPTPQNSCPSNANAFSSAYLPVIKNDGKEAGADNPEENKAEASEELKQDEAPVQSEKIDIPEKTEEVKEDPKNQALEEPKLQNPADVLAAYGYIIEENKQDEDNDYIDFMSSNDKRAANPINSVMFENPVAKSFKIEPSGQESCALEA
eukprot:TRINITY_DN9316_c0_g1_i2.p1 TRINITY_DN9316_c0_g1~~TRINITY_DN9316_c0_g1_i2.p1  ORF type:complete len:198 (+),score=62.58 TRINITY_DN9316_c0_g1_i2:128-721(+)